MVWWGSWGSENLLQCVVAAIQFKPPTPVLSSFMRCWAASIWSSVNHPNLLSKMALSAYVSFTPLIIIHISLALWPSSSTSSNSFRFFLSARLESCSLDPLRFLFSLSSTLTFAFQPSGTNPTFFEKILLLSSSQLAFNSQSFHYNFLRWQGFIFKCNSILFRPMFPCIAKDVSDLFEGFIQSIFVGYNIAHHEGTSWIHCLRMLDFFLQGRLIVQVRSSLNNTLLLTWCWPYCLTSTRKMCYHQPHWTAWNLVYVMIGWLPCPKWTKGQCQTVSQEIPILRLDVGQQHIYVCKAISWFCNRWTLVLMVRYSFYQLLIWLLYIQAIP